MQVLSPTDWDYCLTLSFLKHNLSNIGHTLHDRIKNYKLYQRLTWYKETKGVFQDITEAINTRPKLF